MKISNKQNKGSRPSIGDLLYASGIISVKGKKPYAVDKGSHSSYDMHMKISLCREPELFIITIHPLFPIQVPFLSKSTYINSVMW